MLAPPSTESRFPVTLALVLATVSFPLGLFVGWLVWG
jgi:hypothetical protein